nr:HAD family hydrolase [Nakamurella flavida]
MIYSAAALDLPGPDEQAPTLICAEVLDGVPLSFLTMAALDSLRQVDARRALVPITTRTDAQYRRIRFPGVHPGYAVTTNGGSILVDGVRDPQWRAAMDAAVAASAVPLTVVVDHLAEAAVGDWVLKRRLGDELFCYLVVEPAALPAGFVAELDGWCRARGWWVSRQGRKIYAMPLTLTKERALAEVADRTGARGWLAAGDGALDAGFLAAAEQAMRPPHGELAALGWTAPRVSIATATGVLAGEEMAAWFVDRLG